MASRTKNLSKLFADQKSRTIIILTGMVLISMIIWGVLRINKATDTTNTARVARVPNIQSAPDPERQLSQQMVQNIQQSDVQRLKQAQATKQSALPTLLPQPGKDEPDPDETKAADAASKAKADEAAKKKTEGKADSKQTLTANQLAALNNQVTQSQQALMQAQTQMAQQAAQIQQQAIQDAKEKEQKLSQSMQNQAKAMLSAWAGTPRQTFIQGQLAKDELNNAANNANTTNASDQSNAKDGDATTPTTSKQPAAIKAGDVIFGVLNTAVNSDEPGPVLATIASGKYRGAKIVGAMTQAPELKGTNGPTRVMLSFNTMNVPSLPNSLTINAVAIDADTARTALASEVDHHYLYRYGTLFASAFLEGYGNAITQSGSVVFNDTNGAQTTFQQDLNPTETFLAALGQVGTQLGNKLGDSVDRPNTIIVNSGVSLGILFLSDVTIDQLAG